MRAALGAGMEQQGLKSDLAKRRDVHRAQDADVICHSGWDGVRRDGAV